jgi:hypothetical protein
MDLSNTTNVLAEALSWDAATKLPHNNFSNVLPQWTLGDATDFTVVSTSFQLANLPLKTQGKAVLTVQHSTRSLKLVFFYEKEKENLPWFQVDLQGGMGNSGQGLRFFGNSPIVRAILEKKQGPDPLADFFPLGGMKIEASARIGARFTSEKFQKLIGSGELHFATSKDRIKAAHVKVRFPFLFFFSFCSFRSHSPLLTSPDGRSKQSCVRSWKCERSREARVGLWKTALDLLIGFVPSKKSN